jgi:GntR family transcriptional regulator, transcriptional repressor for pyruvate dehydrogenase complex
MTSRASTGFLGKSQLIALDLLARIADSKIEPGQTFATEAELLEQFDVSRPTLRESIRILESQGVLGQRPGPGGGLVVRRPTLDMLARSLSIYLRFNGVPFSAVLRAREVIEPALAAQAARNGSDGDFDAMMQSIGRMKSGSATQEDFVAENRVFHGIVARASGDSVLETFWGTISLLAHGEHHGVRYTPGNRQHVIAAHEQILAACRSRDPAAAAAAMADHVGELEHLVRDHYMSAADGDVGMSHIGLRVSSADA